MRRTMLFSSKEVTLLLESNDFIRPIPILSIELRKQSSGLTYVYLKYLFRSEEKTHSIILSSRITVKLHSDSCLFFAKALHYKTLSLMNLKKTLLLLVQ